MLVVNISFTVSPVENKRERHRHNSNIMNILVNPFTSYWTVLALKRMKNDCRVFKLMVNDFS